MDRESVEKLSRQSLESSMDQDCVNFYQDKKKVRLDRQQSIERCQETIEMYKNSFSKKKKQFFKEEKNTDMNAIKKAL